MILTNFAVALDWTPNTNHTGFYVARAQGYYEKEGLQVSLNSPHHDEYKTTPAQKLGRGADVAITPSESVISEWFRTRDLRDKQETIKAVAALVQDDLSAIVTLASSNLDRPSKLDGKAYASYGARYEGRIVQQIIKSDGGIGDFKEVTPPMLGIWNTLLQGYADATWVFMGWEGVEAACQGIKLNAFKLRDYGIPYGYTPVLVARASTLRDRAGEVRKFMCATARGYTYAAEHPNEAANILYKAVAADTALAPLPAPLDWDMLRRSQALLSKSYLNKRGRWGEMAPARWDAFLDWLAEQNILTTSRQSRTPTPGVSASLDDLRGGRGGESYKRADIDSAHLFTNAYLPETAEEAS